jgi:hypothetical protein
MTVGYTTKLPMAVSTAVTLSRLTLTRAPATIPLAVSYLLLLTL